MQWIWKIETYVTFSKKVLFILQKQLKKKKLQPDGIISFLKFQIAMHISVIERFNLRDKLTCWFTQRKDDFA